MNLASFRFPKGARKARKRVARGQGSGHGKTSCRGQKGQLSRSGGGKGAAFEGGQMPWQRRLPKYGFTNIFRTEYEPINVGALAVFEAGTEVTVEKLKERRLVRRSAKLVKVLGTGELTVKLTVKAHRFSKQAAEKIAAAGGTAEVIQLDR
jgi:large subunit ribosomal protein L15